VLESDSDSDANDSDFESDESGVVNDVESSSEGDVDLFRDFGWHRGNVNTSRESGSEGVKRAASSFAAW